MLRLLLAPFAFLYGLVVKVRNACFDFGILSSKSYTIPTICVGNLTVGGTGKTPHIEFLVKYLNRNNSVAVLSRGYKRESNGFLLVEPDSPATQVGDEPLQIKRKFNDAIVAVSESRVKGIDQLLSLYPSLDIILLDDAFQHRYVEAGYNILLTDCNNMVTKDFFLPLGTLRDSVSEMRRASCIVITKCPEHLKPIEQRILSKELSIMPYQQLYFSTMVYGNPTPVFPRVAPPLELTQNLKVLSVSGIANPHPFLSHVAASTTVVDKLVLPDHASFTPKRLQELEAKFNPLRSAGGVIITTEKDAARIQSLPSFPEAMKECIYYIPIEVRFIGEKSETDFLNRIDKYVRKSKRDGSIHTE